MHSLTGSNGAFVSEATLSFGSLIGLLVLVLLLGRLLAGLLGWTIRRAVPPARRLATRATGALAERRDLIDAVATRLPRSSRWIGRRVATDRFSGLGLTLMALLAAYLAFLGGHLAGDVIARQAIMHVDAKINAALAPLRNPDLLHGVARITQLAAASTLAAVVLVATAFLWADRRTIYIPGLWLTVLGSEIVTYVGKYAIDRDRPEFLTFASATTPSFPSSHAAGALAAYGFIAYAIARVLPSAALRFELAYWSAALIATIAFSRLLLSVHFTSDVAAGLLIGGFWLLAGFALTEYLNERIGRH